MLSGSRPASASGGQTENQSIVRSSRPGSSVPRALVDENALKDLAEKIQAISKQIKLLQRRKQLGLPNVEPEEDDDEGDSDEDGIDNFEINQDIPEQKIDPIVQLEEDLHLLMKKYEQLNDNTPYQETPESVVKEFCELYYLEFDASTERHANYLAKYYDPAASLVIVGFRTFEDREVIVNMSLRKYDKLPTQHTITSIAVDDRPGKGLLYTAHVNVKIKVAEDEARKVLQIFEFVRAREAGPSALAIRREFLVVKDARPLYHFAESEQPLSSLEKQLLEQKENERKRVALEQQAAAAAEAEKSAQLHRAESVDDEDDGTLEENDNDNDSVKGNSIAASIKS